MAKAAYDLALQPGAIEEEEESDDFQTAVERSLAKDPLPNPPPGGWAASSGSANPNLPYPAPPDKAPPMWGINHLLSLPTHFSGWTIINHCISRGLDAIQCNSFPVFRLIYIRTPFRCDLEMN
jgi:hypothetical protein